MPQYLISVWHDDNYGLDFSDPDAQRRVARVGAFNDQLQQAGAWVFGAGLHPASSATVVRSAGGEVSMTDGPYAETKEQMGGFWIIEASDLDDRASLDSYQPYHAARADLLAGAGRPDDAVTAYNRAIELTTNAVERDFLVRQRAGLRAQTRTSLEARRRSGGHGSGNG